MQWTMSSYNTFIIIITIQNWNKNKLLNILENYFQIKLKKFTNLTNSLENLNFERKLDGSPTDWMMMWIVICIGDRNITWISAPLSWEQVLQMTQSILPEHHCLGLWSPPYSFLERMSRSRGVSPRLILPSCCKSAYI